MSIQDEKCPFCGAELRMVAWYERMSFVCQNVPRCSFRCNADDFQRTVVSNEECGEKK